MAPGLRRFGSVRDPLPIEYGAGLTHALVSNHLSNVRSLAGRFRPSTGRRSS